MRMLNVVNTINPALGGMSEFIRQCSLAWIEGGHSVEILSLDVEDSGFDHDLGIKCHFLGPAFLSYGYNRRLVPWLERNANAFDAVIAHGIWDYSSYAVWKALGKSGIPYFVFPHGMLDPWFKRTYPLKHLKKWVYWRLFEFKVFRDARAVLFTCEEERLLARQSFSKYHCNEIVVCFGTRDPNEGNMDPISVASHFVDRFPEVAKKRYILFLGRIHEKKGCDLLIEAFANVAASESDLYLVMAGPDQTGMVRGLKELAERRGIAERVIWPGMLSGKEKWGAIAGADVFILPSHQENFGIAVTEALAWGVPVLISNKVNIWREIKEDDAGVVGNDDVDGVTEMLFSWLKLTPAERLQMGRCARNCFVRRFEIRQSAKSVFDTIQKSLISDVSVPRSLVESGDTNERSL